MSDPHRRAPPVRWAPRWPRQRAAPSVIQLVFREKGALYAAYIPLFTDGGLFVPTTRDYKLGEDIYLLLSLPDDPQRYPVAGKVAGSRRPMPRAAAPRASACVSPATRRRAC